MPAQAFAIADFLDPEYLWTNAWTQEIETYWFWVESTTTVTVDVEPHAGTHAILHVLEMDIDGNFVEVAFDDSTSSPGGGPSVTVTLEPGMYDVFVRPQNFVSGGSATIFVDSQFAAVLPVNGIRFPVHSGFNILELREYVVGTDYAEAFAFDEDGRIVNHNWQSGLGRMARMWNQFLNATATSVMPVKWVAMPAWDDDLTGNVDILTNDLGWLGWSDDDGDGLGAGLEEALGLCDSHAQPDCSGVLDLRDSDADGIPDYFKVFGYYAGSEPMKLPRWGARPGRHDLFVQVGYTPSCEPDPGDPNDPCVPVHPYADALTEAQRVEFFDYISDAFRGMPGDLLGNRLNIDGVHIHIDAGIDPDPTGLSGQEYRRRKRIWGQHRAVSPMIPEDPCSLYGDGPGQIPPGESCEVDDDGNLILDPTGNPNCSACTSLETWRCAYGIAVEPPGRGFYRLARIHHSERGLGAIGLPWMRTGYTDLHSSRRRAALSFVHELGHTLELGHHGRDQAGMTNCKPNYPSIMNYAAFPLFSYNHPGSTDPPSGIGDIYPFADAFSTGEHSLVLNPSNIVQLGIVNHLPTNDFVRHMLEFGYLYRTEDSTQPPDLVQFNKQWGSVDFNRDGWVLAATPQRLPVTQSTRATSCRSGTMHEEVVVRRGTSSDNVLRSPNLALMRDPSTQEHSFYAYWIESDDGDENRHVRRRTGTLSSASEPWVNGSCEASDTDQRVRQLSSSGNPRGLSDVNPNDEIFPCHRWLSDSDVTLTSTAREYTHIHTVSDPLSGRAYQARLSREGPGQGRLVVVDLETGNSRTVTSNAAQPDTRPLLVIDRGFHFTSWPFVFVVEDYLRLYYGRISGGTEYIREGAYALDAGGDLGSSTWNWATEPSAGARLQVHEGFAAAPWPSSEPVHRLSARACLLVTDGSDPDTNDNSAIRCRTTGGNGTGAYELVADLPLGVAGGPEMVVERPRSPNGQPVSDDVGFRFRIVALRASDSGQHRPKIVRSYGHAATANLFNLSSPFMPSFMPRQRFTQARVHIDHQVFLLSDSRLGALKGVRPSEAANDTPGAAPDEGDSNREQHIRMLPFADGTNDEDFTDFNDVAHIGGSLCRSGDPEPGGPNSCPELFTTPHGGQGNNLSCTVEWPWQE